MRASSSVQAHRAARPRLGAFVDEMIRIDLPQPLLRKGRAGTVAQQALPPLRVVPFDAHAGVERETAAVLAAAHCFAIGLVQQAAPDEEVDDPFPEGRLQLCQTIRCEARFLKTQTLGILPEKHSIDHAM